jgi:hypothetical protein
LSAARTRVGDDDDAVASLSLTSWKRSMGPPFRFRPDPPPVGKWNAATYALQKTTSDDDGESTSASSAAQDTAGFNQGVSYESYPSYANASPWPKNTREEREGRRANSSRKKLPTVGNGIGRIGPIGSDAVDDDGDGGNPFEEGEL